MNAGSVNDLIQLFDGGGNPAGTNHFAGAAPSAFRNDTLFIGARGTGAAIGFLGNIDELQIEAIPEPGMTVAIGAGLLLVLGWTRRSRRSRAA